jgi:hypothetical protein
MVGHGRHVADSLGDIIPKLTLLIVGNIFEGLIKICGVVEADVVKDGELNFP